LDVESILDRSSLFDVVGVTGLVLTPAFVGIVLLGLGFAWKVLESGEGSTGIFAFLAGLGLANFAFYCHLHLNVFERARGLAEGYAPERREEEEEEEEASEGEASPRAAAGGGILQRLLVAVGGVKAAVLRAKAFHKNYLSLSNFGRYSLHFLILMEFVEVATQTKTISDASRVQDNADLYLHFAVVFCNCCVTAALLFLSRWVRVEAHAFCDVAFDVSYTLLGMGSASAASRTSAIWTRSSPTCPPFSRWTSSREFRTPEFDATWWESSSG
jgi:hypothetical protein